MLQVLGTDELHVYLNKYGIELDAQLEALVGRHSRKPWNKFTTPANQHLVSAEATDFLDKLLRYDHQVSFTSFQYIGACISLMSSQCVASSPQELAGAARQAQACTGACRYG